MDGCRLPKYGNLPYNIIAPIEKNGLLCMAKQGSAPKVCSFSSNLSTLISSFILKNP
jgi:hypothetical protein